MQKKGIVIEMQINPHPGVLFIGGGGGVEKEYIHHGDLFNSTMHSRHTTIYNILYTKQRGHGLFSCITELGWIGQNLECTGRQHGIGCRWIAQHLSITYKLMYRP